MLLPNNRFRGSSVPIKAGLARILFLTLMFLVWIPSGACFGQLSQFLAAHSAGERAQKQGDIQTALKHYETALDIATKHKIPDQNQASLYANMGNCYLNLGHPKLSWQILEQAEKLNLQTFGENDARTSQVYKLLASAYVMDNQPRKAIEPLKKHAQIEERLKGKNSIGGLVAWAAYYFLLSQFEPKEAERGMREVVSIARQRYHNHAETADILLDQDLVLQTAGNFQEAVNGLDEAEAIIRRLNNGRGQFLHRLFTARTNLLLYIGNYPAAEQMCWNAVRQAGELSKTLPNYRISGASSLVVLGEIQTRLGSYQAALETLKAAQFVFNQANQSDSFALAGQAKVHAKMGDYRTAKAIYEKVIQENRSRINPAFIQFELGDACWKLGEIGPAFDHMRAAMSELAKFFGERNPHLARLQVRMADLLIDDGQPEEAEKYLTAASQVLGTTNQSSLVILGEIDLVQAKLHQSKNEPSEALMVADEARRKFHRYTQDVLPWLPAADQRNFIENVDRPHLESALRLALSLKDDEVYATDAFIFSAEWIINSKGQAFEAAAKMRLFARELDDPESAESLSRYATLQSLIARRMNEPLPSQDAVKAIFDARRDIEMYAEKSREMQQKLAKQFKESSDRSVWIELHKIRSQLPDDAVFLDLVAIAQTSNVRSQRTYWAWSVTKDGTHDRILQVCDAEQVRVPLRAFHALVDNDKVIDGYTQKAEAVLAESGREAALAPMVGLGLHGVDLQEKIKHISESLLKPCRDQLIGKKQLILCPDGPLWTVPWAALELDEDTCLLDQVTIRHLTSGRQMLVPRQSQKASPSQLVLNPDFELASSHGPNAKRVAKEVPLDLLEEIASDLQESIRKLTQGDVILLTGKAATEEALSKIVSPEVFVLGTHGAYYNQDSPQYENMYAHDPLIRCLLTMAGCNWERPQTQADAILYGTEIVSMDLRGTDLVFLMACQSGLGDETWGESPAGLNHAFHLAGSRVVAATLWSVIVGPTAELSVEYFAKLAEGESEIEAMRSAQLKIKADYESKGIRNASLWSTYVVSGW